jgi:actin
LFVDVDFVENQRYKNQEVYHTLPDGQKITLTIERFMAPEILFTPSLFRRKENGISESINQSIKQCYSEFREVLSENIIISAGNTRLPGFEKRIINDLNENKLFYRKLRARFTQDKTASSWIGAKIFSELQCFDEYWITKEEYEENGPSIIHRKCF